MTQKSFVAILKILIAGFATGIVFQLNWAKGLLLDQGLLSCIVKHSLRIIISGSAGALFFWGIYRGVQKFWLYNQRLDIKQLESFLATFSVLGLYLFFPPSEQLLVFLLLLVPIVFKFKDELCNIFKHRSLLSLLYIHLLILTFLGFKEILLLFYSSSSYSYYHYTLLIWIPLAGLVLPLLFPRYSFVYALILWITYFIAAFLLNSHIILYGSEMPESTYYAIWETTITESKDFVKEYISVPIVGINILLLVITGFFVFRAYRIQREQLRLDFFNRLFVVSLIGLLVYNQPEIFFRNLPVKFIVSYKKFKDDLRRFEREFNFRKEHPLSGQADVHCTDSVSIFVLVIGESASKYHQGLYGYARNTNPLLGSIKDELFIFDSVIAPHSHTNPVLAKVLSFANFENMELLYTKRSLIEYMKDAGYKTYWFSNQQFANEFNSLSTLIALQADKRFFSNYNNIDSVGSISIYDEVLLKPFEEALKEEVPKKFIVLHLMGSHSDKAKRYPKLFEKYNDTTDIPHRPYNREWVYHVINSHDNSVLYTDYVLFETIQMLKKTEKVAVWLYFSDHGEEIFDYRDFWGHSEANASVYMVDIPFVLWFSDKYRVVHRERVASIKKYLLRKYQTDDVIHSIIDLIGCKSADFDSTKSIFSPYFRYEKRYIYGHDYDSLLNKHKKSITD